MLANNLYQYNKIYMNVFFFYNTISLDMLSTANKENIFYNIKANNMSVQYK